MKITNKKLMQLACKLEGGKRQVDAAEAMEFLRWVRALLAAVTDEAPYSVDDWVCATKSSDVTKAREVIEAARARKAKR